jgi:nitroreductase
MNAVMDNIYGRRSVRAYTEEPIPEDKIMEIIKAGVHAPNGANSQPLRFAVVTNADKKKQYSDISKALFVENMKKAMEQAAPDKKKFFEVYIERLSKPEFDIFYGAPILVLIYSSPESFTPVEDGSLAAENMMLAAHSMGIGSCWIGFASPLGYVPEVFKELNVPEDHRLIAPLVFGYPKKKDMAPTQRSEPKITAWLR